MGSSLERHTKGSEKECATEEKNLRSKERRGEEEEEEEGGSIPFPSFPPPLCRRLSAARILRNSQTRGLNLLFLLPLPPVRFSLDASFLSRSHPPFLTLSFFRTLFCGRIPLCAHRPPATDLAPSCATLGLPPFIFLLLLSSPRQRDSFLPISPLFFRFVLPL